MICTVKILNKDGTVSTPNLYNSAAFDDRLDEQLDTGSIQIITDSADVPFPDFCHVKIELKDNDNTKKTLRFCGFRSVEKRKGNYFIHKIELVEPTRLLMGSIIEGMKVTQPIEGSVEQRKTLWDVLVKLVTTFETLTYEIRPINGKEQVVTLNQKYTVYTGGNQRFVRLLETTEAPEFHWEAGTLLWECLCDIGNVINATPRLVDMNPQDWKANQIAFDLINESDKEYEL